MMTRMLRFNGLALGSTMLVAALLVGTGAVAAQSERTYQVTIINMVPGQPIAPPVVLLHTTTQRVNLAGGADQGIQKLAENGDSFEWVDSLDSDPNVLAVATGDVPIVAGGVPGAATFPGFAKFELSASKKARYIDVLGMLMCTNDGFAILADGKLPKKVGQVRVFETMALDAGTEMNTEDFANMVPPCQTLVGVSSADEGTADSDESIAEGGVIKPHPGIAGGIDLDPEIHTVASIPALVIVERIS